jgi:anti-sigma B factor antagonist
MELTTLVENGIKILVVQGRLDSTSVGGFREKFNEETLEDDAVILDFTGLEYLDSSGLATLVNIYKVMQSRSGRLAMCGLSEDVMRVVRFTKLDRIFTLADTREQALEKVK